MRLYPNFLEISKKCLYIPDELCKNQRITNKNLVEMAKSNKFKDFNVIAFNWQDVSYKDIDSLRTHFIEKYTPVSNSGGGTKRNKTRKNRNKKSKKFSKRKLKSSKRKLKNSRKKILLF